VCDWATGWMTMVRFCHHIQTGSGAHPAYYSTGIAKSFPRGKVAGA